MGNSPRDRIKEIRTVKGRDLLPNPDNWRTHPPEQARALRGLLKDVGQVDILRAVETPAGLMLVDGHLRSELEPDAEWKVAVLDLSPEEARLVLATFDPVAAMAKADQEKLDALLLEIDAESKEVAELLASLASESPEDAGKEIDLSPTYGVLIHVRDELAQRALLRTADEAGFDATAILTGIVEPPKHDEPPPPVKAGITVIERESKIKRSVRVRQVEGMFDLPKSGKQKRRWELNLEIPDEWSIGLIVGPSGSGKSTLAREWFGQALVNGWQWDDESAVVDGFPEAMPIAEVTSLLSSVGFSSPPGWVKPFGILSNGEKFRVELARSLAEQPGLAVIDEFTSVVDRTVAKVGSHAAQKAVRATGRRLVAVTCHYDVADWLQPDWTLDMLTGEMSRRSLRRRPDIQIVVRRAHRDEWEAFREHHYLNHSFHKGSTAFIAEIDKRPAAFCATMFDHSKSSAWRTHRLVTHPDFQGIGVGHALHDLVAGMYAAKGVQYRVVTSHPSMIGHCVRSSKWICIGNEMGEPRRQRNTDGSRRWVSGAAGRNVARFRYVGPVLAEQAAAFGVLDNKKSRPKTHDRGYGWDWQKFRKRYLKANPYCCREGCREPATDVDHEPPITGRDDPGRLDPARCRSLCHSHHSQKTAAQREAKRVELPTPALQTS